MGKVAHINLYFTGKLFRSDVCKTRALTTATGYRHNGDAGHGR
jgi:hypothetical protein